jgi:transposase, IS30 family
MGRPYVQLSFEDRCEIARRKAEGQSIRKIAADLDRAPSSIARELKRNTGRTVGYKPDYANEQTKARRWKGSKLARKPELQTDVLAQLARGVSPEQIAGRMIRDKTPERVSHETIYRFIYAEIARTKDFGWRHFLPRAKSKRGIRGVRGGSAASFIQGRISVHNRTLEASDRRAPGHWEADLVSFAKSGQFILTVHERQSRILLAARPENKTADLIAKHLFDLLKTIPKDLRRTLTFDNGTEFARHLNLHPLGFQTYFCDPHAPWQKGGIENAHGRLRRFLPRKTDLKTITPRHFKRILQAYNATPRKCLDFLTPAEVFLDQVLHFKCEPTSPPARG